MKYIRRITAVVLIFIFCIAMMISVAVAMSVRNVNLTYYDHTGTSAAAYEITLDNLEDLKGKNISSIGEDDVLSCLSDPAHLELLSFEKEYPCTVNVVVEERVETFYSEDNGVCSVYDAGGALMYTSENIVGGSGADGYILAETSDNSPNVIIESSLSTAERTFIAESCSTFSRCFGSLRRLVLSVTREKTPEYENLVFVLRTGLKVEISNCEVLTDSKIEAAFSKYAVLSDAEKTSGKVRAYVQEGIADTVKSVYTP